MGIKLLYKMIKVKMSAMISIQPINCRSLTLDELSNFVRLVNTDTQIPVLLREEPLQPSVSYDKSDGAQTHISDATANGRDNGQYHEEDKQIEDLHIDLAFYSCTLDRRISKRYQLELDGR